VEINVEILVDERTQQIAYTIVLCDRIVYEFGNSRLQFHLQDGLHFGNGESFLYTLQHY